MTDALGTGWDSFSAIGRVGCGLEPCEDSGRRSTWVRGDVERSSAGDVRGRHAGTADGVVRAAFPSGVDRNTRCTDDAADVGGEGGEVREAGERIIGTVA